MRKRAKPISKKARKPRARADTAAQAANCAEQADRQESELPAEQQSEFPDRQPVKQRKRKAYEELNIDPSKLLFWDKRMLLAHVPVSYPTICEWMKEGKFPLPHHSDSGRRVLWKPNEVKEAVNLLFRQGIGKYER